MCILELLHQLVEWLKPFAEICVAIGTIGLAYFTYSVVTATKKLAEGAKSDSAKQLSVQVWLDFSKQFDSDKIRASRKELAIAASYRINRAVQYLSQQTNSNHQVLSGLASSSLLSFFEDLGNVWDQDLIHEELTKEAFGYHVRRWWMILENDIHELQKQRSQPQLYKKFEDLAEDLALKTFKIDDKDIKQFIVDEQHPA